MCTNVAVDGLLDLLAGLVGGRVEERAKGLDALCHLCGDGANLSRLLLGRRARLSVWLRVSPLRGATHPGRGNNYNGDKVGG